VGRTHDWGQYAAAGEVCGRLARYAFLDGAQGTGGVAQGTGEKEQKLASED
jgi:hypothetical protein